MIAPFQARDHRFCHREPVGELLLRLARVGAKLEQAMGALRGDGGAVVECRAPQGLSVGLGHRWRLARLRR
jgi:hypothetical protein